LILLLLSSIAFTTQLKTNMISTQSSNLVNYNSVDAVASKLFLFQEKISHNASVTTTSTSWTPLTFYTRTITTPLMAYVKVSLRIPFCGNDTNTSRNRLLLKFDGVDIASYMQYIQNGWGLNDAVISGTIFHVAAGDHKIEVFAAVDRGTMYCPHFNGGLIENTLTPAIFSNLVIKGNLDRSLSSCAANKKTLPAPVVQSPVWQMLQASSLVQVSAGPNNQVWGISPSDGIYFRTGISASNFAGSDWQNVAGALINVSVGKGGRVWGVNRTSDIYFRTGITDANQAGTGWLQITGGLSNISVGPNGDCWGVNSLQQIYRRTGITDSNPSGSGWEQVTGGLVNISVGKDGQVWGTNASHQIFRRTAITPSNPSGSDWALIDGGLNQISVGTDGQVWGVNGNGLIFVRLGITDSNLNGTSWKQIDGGLNWVTRGASVTWGVNGNKQVYIRQYNDLS